MQASANTTKITNMVSEAINTLIVASGTVAFIWILAFLIVAMIDK
jgi:hypothetical protein